MSAAVIEAIRDKIVRAMPADSAPVIVWHAGEPTTAPLTWYERAYDRLAAVAPRRTSFAMQSNGIAIDARWTALFRATSTNVSLSIDGAQRFHDRRRRTRSGAPLTATSSGLRATNISDAAIATSQQASQPAVTPVDTSRSAVADLPSTSSARMEI
jgi:sulfatase maturation enzyme AslB (radical SAM superfamily)